MLRNRGNVIFSSFHYLFISVINYSDLRIVHPFYINSATSLTHRDGGAGPKSPQSVSEEWNMQTNFFPHIQPNRYKIRLSMSVSRTLTCAHIYSYRRLEHNTRVWMVNWALSLRSMSRLQNFITSTETSLCESCNFTIWNHSNNLSDDNAKQMRN